MKNRLLVLALALTCCGSVALGLTSGQNAAKKKKCVGVTSVKLNQRVIRVYRIFEDGSLEILDDGGNPNANWQPIGK